MTQEHENYLKEGITRVLTNCNQWQSDDTSKRWDDHMSDVNKDLATGNFEKYGAMLKNAYHADKVRIANCYINDAYIISVIKMFKVFKEDYNKHSNKNIVNRRVAADGSKEKIKSRDIKFNPEDEYVL